MKPRKDERSSAAKLLKAEAAKLRNYAEGHRKLAQERTKPDVVEYLNKEADRKDRKAEIWDKVAKWILEQ